MKINFLFFFIFYLFLSPISVLSQVQISSYSFLNTQFSPRTLSMGGEVISILDDDVNLSFTTPSLLNNSMDGIISFSFTDYISDINLFSFVYSKNLSERYTFMTGINSINYGLFVETDEVGNNIGEFSANQHLLVFGVSNEIHKNINLGMNLRLMNSYFDRYNSFSISSNISMTYFSSDRDFATSLLFKNIGRPLTSFTNNLEELPFEVQLGFSKSLDHLPFRYSIVFHNINTYDISNIFDSYSYNDNTLNIKQESVAKKLLRHLIIGGELNPFRKSLYIRGGFNFQRREDLRLLSSFSMSGFSWGFGLSIKKIRINYSMSNFHVSSIVNSFSIDTNLSNFGVK
ncbi:MAG: hypothetical protein CMP51_06710 [Flavobacteriales bacterium]|nr:hypothetical protein [Flavobacteriales bacterium]